MTINFKIKNEIAWVNILVSYHIISHPEYGVVGIIFSIQNFKRIQYAN